MWSQTSWKAAGRHPVQSGVSQVLSAKRLWEKEWECGQLRVKVCIGWKPDTPVAGGTDRTLTLTPTPVCVLSHVRL